MKKLIHFVKHYLPILLLIMAFYGVRLWLWYETDVKFPIRPPWVIVQLFARLLIGGLITGLVGIIVLLLSKQMIHSTISSRLLLVGLACTLFLPLPQAPPLPEATHFLKYQSDYEQIVDVIKKDERTYLEDGYCLSLSQSLIYISPDQCVDVRHTESSLFIRFNPTGRDYPVVYIESDKDINYCLYDFYVEKEIVPNWYTCYEDWN